MKVEVHRLFQISTTGVDFPIYDIDYFWFNFKQFKDEHGCFVRRHGCLRLRMTVSLIGCLRVTVSFISLELRCFEVLNLSFVGIRQVTLNIKNDLNLKA